MIKELRWKVNRLFNAVIYSFISSVFLTFMIGYSIRLLWNGIIPVFTTLRTITTNEATIIQWLFVFVGGISFYYKRGRLL